MDRQWLADTIITNSHTEALDSILARVAEDEASRNDLAKEIDVRERDIGDDIDALADRIAKLERRGIRARFWDRLRRLVV